MIKIYTIPMKLLSFNNEEYTLNTIPKNTYRLMINRTACVSLFFSLMMNSLPSRLFSTNQNSGSLNDTSNVLLDSNVKTGRNLENSEINFDFPLARIEPIHYDSIFPSHLDDTKTPEKKGIEKMIDDNYIATIYQFMEEESLSIDAFIKLVDSMVSDDGPFGKLYSNKKSAIDALLSEYKSYEVKFLIVLARENYTYQQLDYMCAGITGESTGDGHCYDDAYAVASTLINRSHTAWYVSNYGHDFFNIFTAPGQYEIEVSGNYLKFLGAIELEGYRAAVDAFYTRESIHKWLQFRARWVELNCTYETFADGGNKFLDKMEDYEFVPYPDEEINLEAVKKMVLNINS